MRKVLIIIFISCLALYAAQKLIAYKKHKIIENVIAELDSYEQSHGFYPPNLLTVHKSEIDWLYYYNDSIKNSFVLKYTSGIMESNTMLFDSKTKKWENLFNY